MVAACQGTDGEVAAGAGAVVGLMKLTGYNAANLKNRTGGKTRIASDHNSAP